MFLIPRSDHSCCVRRATETNTSSWDLNFSLASIPQFLLPLVSLLSLKICTSDIEHAQCLALTFFYDQNSPLLLKRLLVTSIAFYHVTIENTAKDTQCRQQLPLKLVITHSTLFQTKAVKFGKFSSKNTANSEFLKIRE